MRNPTMIADYSGLARAPHKKFDYNFTSLPGDDKPVRSGADMFPKGVVRQQDTFDQKPAAQSMSDKPKTAQAVTKPARPKKAAHPPHCIIS